MQKNSELSVDVYSTCSKYGLQGFVKELRAEMILKDFQTRQNVDSNQPVKKKRV